MTDSQSALLNTTPKRRILIVITVMLVAILEVLDSTIVNVALPHMMPALGANQDQITWVLTSYIVSSAVMLPLTGFLSTRLGEKRLLLTNISGFMISSFLCGTAGSLSTMILFRALQGCFGASLIPLSQSILKQTFSPEKQGKAMGIWAMGVLVAPVLGPTLGGFITQTASWRWIFYINAPICAAALAMAIRYIPKIKANPQSIDWVGIGLMVVGIASFQILLDQGNSKDWFNSDLIVSLGIIAVVGLTLFIVRSFTSKKPAVNLRLFGNRTFSMSTLSLMFFCGAQFSLLALEPIMLQTLFNYTSLLAGITTITMGLFSSISVAISANIINRVNVKLILITGCILCIIGTEYLASLNLAATQGNFLIANSFLGAGMGCLMLPLSISALSNLPPKAVTEGAGLFSSGRMLGTSIGISLMSTLVSQQTQINWNSLGANITSFNINLRQWLWHQHSSLHNPVTLHLLQQTVYQQASMRAFLNAFYLIGFCYAMIIPMVLLMKPIKLSGTTMMH